MTCGQIPAACSDLSQFNENNEQVGLGQSGSHPIRTHCTIEHRTGKAQGALILRFVSPNREREQGAAMIMDQGTAKCSQRTDSQSRNKVCGQYCCSVYQQHDELRLSTSYWSCSSTIGEEGPLSQVTLF